MALLERKSSCCVLEGYNMSPRVLLVVVLGVGLLIVSCCGGNEIHMEIKNTECREKEVKREYGSGGGGEGRGECPTWTLPAGNDSHLCVCGDSLENRVRCDPCNVFIHRDFCMTYDNTQHITYVGFCPHGVDHRYSKSRYIALPQNVSELNSAMCGPLNRQGRVCGECKSGYGPAVLSLNFNCYRCSGSYHGWGLYLFLELFPVTLLFLLIMLFQFRATSGSVNCFLLLAQFTAIIYHYIPPADRYPFGHTSNYVIDTILVVYGFWNLDFFKPIVPPFCVSPNITGLYANAMLYIAVIHLMLLTALACLLIELHARNYRVIVWLWRPIHKYYVKVHRNVNPRTSIIDAIATFLVLSCSRIMLASFLLLIPVYLYAPTGEVVKYTVYSNGNLNYLGYQHIPFVMLAVIVLVLFNILPAIFLLLYPCKCFQKLLQRFTRASQLLHPFADTFQGCYKNGADGGRDYRCFAGLYKIFRIVLFLIFTIVDHPGALFLGGLLLLLVSLSFAVLRPYRNNWYNIIDTLLFAVYTVALFSQFAVFTADLNSVKPYQIAVQLGFLIPLAYIACYMLYYYVVTPLYRRARRERGGRGRHDTVGEEGDLGDLPYRMLDSPAPPARWHSDTVDYITTYNSCSDKTETPPSEATPLLLRV